MENYSTYVGINTGIVRCIRNQLKATKSGEVPCHKNVGMLMKFSDNTNLESILIREENLNKQEELDDLKE